MLTQGEKNTCLPIEKYWQRNGFLIHPHRCQISSINATVRERSRCCGTSTPRQEKPREVQGHLDGCDDILKGHRCVGQLGLPDEPLPLNLLGLVIHKRWIEDRGLDGNRRISVLECFFDGLGQHLPLEVKRAGQHPVVVKVLHPAVQDAELHHGMELFGDGALHSDIDLQRDPRVAKAALDPDARLRIRHPP